MSGTPLADAYGLARHRDGRWEWASAPGTMPSPRYQHGAVFVGARLHIFGGAVGGGKMVDEPSSVVVLDTAAGQWLTQGAAGHPGSDDVMRRCRHAMAAVGPYIFVHGGLKGSTLLEDVLLADDSSGAELSICDPRSPAWQQWINSMHGSEAAAAALANAAAEEAAAAAALSMRRVGNMEDLRCLDEDLDENMRLNKVRAAQKQQQGVPDHRTHSCCACVHEPLLACTWKGTATLQIAWSAPARSPAKLRSALVDATPLAPPCSCASCAPTPPSRSRWRSGGAASSRPPETCPPQTCGCTTGLWWWRRTCRGSCAAWCASCRLTRWVPAGRAAASRGAAGWARCRTASRTCKGLPSPSRHIGRLLKEVLLCLLASCLLCLSACLQFENESRRVSMGAGLSEPTSVRNKTPLFERSYSEPVGGPFVAFRVVKLCLQANRCCLHCLCSA